MSGLCVLGLFDGISCGQLALRRAGIELDTYFASEIDRNAITVTQSNFSNTVQLGDVCDLSYRDGMLYSPKGTYKTKIDMLIGGSPCQGFSSSGKGLNFNDPRSRLFFEYSRLLKEVKPKYFLLENVKMRKEWVDIISQEVGAEPLELNSALVSAQNRVRLYWTNIPVAQPPEDRGILLKDILETTDFLNPSAVRGRRLADKDSLNKAAIVGRRLSTDGHRKDNDKTVPITQCLEVRSTNRDKSNCLTTVGKDNVLTSLPPGRYPNAFKDGLPFRYYTIKEYCRLQTLPDNYTRAVSDSIGKKLIGNGWTVDMLAYLFSHIPHDAKE